MYGNRGLRIEIAERLGNYVHNRTFILLLRAGPNLCWKITDPFNIVGEDFMAGHWKL